MIYLPYLVELFSLWSTPPMNILHSTTVGVAGTLFFFPALSFRSTLHSFTSAGKHSRGNISGTSPFIEWLKFRHRPLQPLNGSWLLAFWFLWQCSIQPCRLFSSTLAVEVRCTTGKLGKKIGTGILIAIIINIFLSNTPLTWLILVIQYLN